MFLIRWSEDPVDRLLVIDSQLDWWFIVRVKGCVTTGPFGIASIWAIGECCGLQVHTQKCLGECVEQGLGECKKAS